MTTVALSKPVPKPAHIPDSAVYDFDMFADPEYLKDPHVRVADLVKNAPPVFWTPRYGGHWMICSHAAVFAAARDIETFSSEIVPRAYIREMLAKLPPGTPHIPTAVPITLDPPEHTKYRMPLNRPFGPKAINELRESIRALTNEAIDAVIARGHCEFMREVAEVVPVKVFLKMMGLPLDRMAEYREIVNSHLSDPAPNPAEGVKKLWRITATMKDTILERQKNPQNDLISMLWTLQIDGQPMTLADMEDYCVVLFIAGLDTVMNGIGHGIRHFARDQALQSELRKNPAKIGEATEEMLRRYTFTIPPRVVAKDTVFEGVPMKKGERAMLFLPAADLDPKEYPNPETFDLNRQNSVHIAFNAGPHRCLGSHLARVELQVVYEQMITRLPPFRLDPANPPTFHGGHVVGIDTLHLVWDA
jgi:cytochrome P450